MEEESVAPALPLVTAATKADQLKRLCILDKKTLKRPQAHCSNALKTTERLQSLSEQLRKGLSEVNDEHDSLQVAAIAFDRVIADHSLGPYSKLLQNIKDGYDRYLKHLSNKPCQRPIGDNEAANNSPQDACLLQQLEAQVSEREAACKAAMEQNKRLCEELSREKSTHQLVMNQLNAPVTDPEEDSSEGCDYKSRVEEIQLKIVEEHEAIANALERRNGRVPISVCNHLEQCLREVELDTQKLQKRSESMQQEIMELQEHLLKVLQDSGMGNEAIGKFWKELHKQLA